LADAADEKKTAPANIDPARVRARLEQAMREVGMSPLAEVPATAGEGQGRSRLSTRCARARGAAEKRASVHEAFLAVPAHQVELELAVLWAR
jgi:hypothetical protein